MFLFVGCEDKDDVQRYEQEVLTTSGNPLTYTSLTSYPVIGPITSSAPAGDFETPYRYRLLNAASSTGSSFTKAAFTVDGDTGVVAYGNAGNTITPGTYSVDIGVTNSNGMAVHEGAYQLTILDVPVQVDIDAAQVDAGIFEQGVMATVSYTDTSASGSDITSVSYALVNAPAGFEINPATGAISKVNGAVESIRDMLKDLSKPVKEQFMSFRRKMMREEEGEAILTDKDLTKKPELKDILAVKKKEKKIKVGGQSKIEVNPKADIGQYSGGTKVNTGNLH